MTPCPECPMPPDRACNHVLCAFFHSGNETKVRHVQALAVMSAAEAPTFATRAATFAGAIATSAASGFERATPDEVDRRLAICRECEHYTGEQRCDICTCYMPLKTRLASLHCPLDPPRW